MRLALYALIYLMAFANFGTTYAADIQACGIPEAAALNTDGADYCDIYTRQMAYRLTRLEHRKLLEERQKNFAAPRDQALKNYKQELETLNENRNERAE